MISFENQRVLLTGATGGIGAESLRQFLELGAQVFITTTNKEKAEELINKHANLPGKIAGVYIGDISKGIDCVTQAVESIGGIDVFVHAAGITKDNIFMRLTEADWDAVHNINLKAAFTLSQACVMQMMKQRYGRIVLVTSVVGSMGNVGQANYIASKAGLTGLAKGIARDCASRNIVANCVEPGFIDTPMTACLPEEIKQKILTGIPMGRMGTAEEVANCITFLSSKQASYISGTTIRVNGGMLMI